ncbi:efflux RND transporter permease subunit [Pseudomonas sp. PDM09]|uniref:efflux RND transporter permease subunit n=1 Tax=Pseudomonas sp. PDM09 TaxID=2769270 RepID=UPI00178227DA|nr:MMPL family transporter [Pseudomonas sp. PDM09]MBD9562228.1 RND family transporter [Pseudomonas sp. PDM09]
MNAHKTALPVISDPNDFDRNSGDWLERMVFNNRIWVLLFCAIITLFFSYRATQLTVNASFDEMVPQKHPFIKNYLENKDSLKGLGNSIRVVVETQSGDIFDPEYLEVVRRVNDKIFLTPGVDRALMRSVWTPIVRWTEITEEGYKGGPVMPFDYDASANSIKTFKLNALRANLRGNLIGSDYKSSMIMVPLLDKLADTGVPLDYKALSDTLEQEIRAPIEHPQADSESAQLKGSYKIHIIGFAKLTGDLIDGLAKVLMFFGLSALIAAAIIYLYTRDLRSTALLVLTALCGVIWLLGLMQLLGYDLNPYSILVPFLIFAIGISHGAQKMNGVMQDIGRGTHKYVAARYTFRRLFMAGLTALLTNVVGFAVLMIIDIPVIQTLALTTSVGVLILIFTKLFFIPVALSYIGVSEKAAQRSIQAAEKAHQHRLNLWSLLVRCTERRVALPLVVVSLAVGAVAITVSLKYLKIGDLDKGAPELRAESRYNQDSEYINEYYGLSGDQFAVIVKSSEADGVSSFQSLVKQDRLAWMLKQLPEVLATSSLPDSIRQTAYGQFEGNPKWRTIPRNPGVIGQAVAQAIVDSPGAINGNGTVTPMIAYLKDHKADTLTAVAKAVETFAAENNDADTQFLLAAGSAGIEAATNIVVKEANYRILALLYAAVTLLCFITFRSWRAVVVAMVPLLITSFLCEALMVALGIGIKVATLPVIALGVGVGVDYALYLLSVQMRAQRLGATLAESYELAIGFTGKVVALIGITMAAGVMTWAWSPIKFQADMGILLTFMFLWNMLGALVLIPALSSFLLNDRKDIQTSVDFDQVSPHPTVEPHDTDSSHRLVTHSQGIDALGGERIS